MNKELILSDNNANLTEMNLTNDNITLNENMFEQFGGTVPIPFCIGEKEEVIDGRHSCFL